MHQPMSNESHQLHRRYSCKIRYVGLRASASITSNWDKCLGPGSPWSGLRDTSHMEERDRSSESNNPSNLRDRRGTLT